jgi:D-glycero-D-manno-heptose 1,7-bisphosphate phosphatase
MERTGVSDSRRRAVFLDRDGTIIEEVGYLTEVQQICVLPGATEALRRLKEAGYLLLVVTNQSAIARGWLTEERLAAIHEALNARLATGGAAIDAFYYCPHLPDGAVELYAQTCNCRKPADGMLREAARDWNVALDESYMIGDSARDVEAGRLAGCRTFRVGTDSQGNADWQVNDLAEAAAIILEREHVDT